MDAGVLLALGDDGWSVADPSQPLLHADDLAATRGDGVFEAIGVFDGIPLALDAHVRRLADSMGAMDLRGLDLAATRRAVLDAIDRHPHERELLVKLYVSHGREAGPCSSWIHVRRGADHTGARRDGLAVVLLRRGMSRAAAAGAPWLLPGVKSLSYAVPRAALREAHRRGADDAILTTDDGFVLEGAASSVVLRVGGVWTTPDPADGALSGTTQGLLFDGLRAEGMPTEVRSVAVAELSDADAVWLCSSGRLIAPVRSIDGAGISASAESTRVLWRALGVGAGLAGAPVDEEAPC